MLKYLDVTSAGSMNVTCANYCITTVTTKYIPSICPSPYQDEAICRLIASTTIAFQSGYSMWTCNAYAFTSTNPCTPSVWSGLLCSASFVSSLTIPSSVSGMNDLRNSSYLLTFGCYFRYYSNQYWKTKYIVRIKFSRCNVRLVQC